jgi:thioredoxin 1
MIEINTIDELKSAVEQNENVVVDLYATWCVPCQQMLPVIEELAGETPAVPFYKVDIDKVPEAKEFTGAKAVPMLLIYKNGRKKEFAFGITPKDKIKGKLERTMR